MKEINYKVIKSFRKTLTMQIKNGELIVKSPFFTSDNTILSFIEKHKKWISNRLEEEKNKIILGKDDIEKLKIKSKNYIIPRVKIIADKFGFKYNNVKITSAKSRWGSCTSRKNLNFSYRLILTPKEVIDYVIIHELSHLKHMNHSKSFWNEVESMMPDYKVHEKWLKENGNLIG